MAKERGLGKCLSSLSFVFIDGGRSGQGISIVQPAQQVTILAGFRAERSMVRRSRLAAQRALAKLLGHGAIAWAKAACKARAGSQFQRISRAVVCVSSRS